MPRPTVRIQRLDIDSSSPANYASDANPTGELSETLGTALDFGTVPPVGASPRSIFRITVDDWHGAALFENASVWVENTALRMDSVLMGFTDTWSARDSVTLSAAPASPPASPNAPPSWSLTHEVPTSGYCVLQFQKSETEYPNTTYGAGGIGTIAVHVSGEHD